MQFEDATKKYEINFDRIRNKGAGSTPVFKMVMDKPVKGFAYFDVHDIKTQSGKTGINVNSGSEIAKAIKSKGKDVLIVVSSEALDFVRNIHEEELNRVKEEAKKDPESWRWWTGCDTGNLYISPNSETGCEFRSDLERIKDTLEKVHKFHAHELFGKEEEENLVSHETVLKIYNEIRAEKEAKKTEQKTKENEIFEKAKATGERQVLESYPVECSDPDEECDIDIVTVYAMPDGTILRTQNHTW